MTPLPRPELAIRMTILSRQKANDFSLNLIGILKLIDKQRAKTVLIVTPYSR